MIMRSHSHTFKYSDQILPFENTTEASFFFLNFFLNTYEQQGLLQWEKILRHENKYQCRKVSKNLFSLAIKKKKDGGDRHKLVNIC